MRAALLLAPVLTVLVVPSLRAEPPLPWGDQGDGTYRNPILPADYSDPDLIRVGSDFYMVASEFHFVGIQVLHSRDLVNWRIVGQVYDRLGMDARYDEMRGYGQGTWAPSLRYHDGRFYLYVCTPREGLFLWTSADPAGPWSERITVESVAEWEDPCPFWDDDGRAWLVHGRLGAGPLVLHRLSADGRKLLDGGVEIYRGPVAEGPKLFKRNGWYYISLPEGGVERGGQSILRARDIRGPYERRVVVPDGGPHQGGLVELEDGRSWFIGFKSAGHLGRISFLQPVRWGDDDWPVFGDGGRPLLGGPKPAVGAGAPIEHPQTSDGFDAPTLQPQWQWNHNPLAEAWSLAARAGWLRLRGQPAEELALARNTLTQKIWGQSGLAELKLDAAGLADGQRAGLAFLCGKTFSLVGVERAGGRLRFFWDGGKGRLLPGTVAWLRARYRGDRARLEWSVDGTAFVDSGLDVRLSAGQWKGARLALFCYGADGGWVDFDEFLFTHGSDPVALSLPTATPIDREALVRRHSPVLRSVEATAPLTVGNGGFAFTADVTGLQTFGDHNYEEGIPLETLARWCWTTEDNPNGYRLADTLQTYRKADGTTIGLPSRLGTPASEWLRRNPRLHPLGRLALEWDKPDGSPFTPADVREPEQRLDLWSGVLTSRYLLGGVPVKVTTASDPRTDTVAVRLESDLVAQGRLRFRLAFPRGHDTGVKNTPSLDWSRPEAHVTLSLGAQRLERQVGSTTYYVSSNRDLARTGPHEFLLRPGSGPRLDLVVRFSAVADVAVPGLDQVLSASAAHWTEFWRSGAAVDLTGSTNPLAASLEQRIVLSRYLTAVQCVGAVPPQESGLTCNTWYGKHHTEMVFWHAAHFVLWGRPDLAQRSLDWFLENLPEARALAASRGLRGARWAKMVGPRMRESPGGNPLIVWNQPHPIYLSELLLRQSPSAENLARYAALVLETAECLVSMLVWDAGRAQYVLGPPLWTAQELHDPATSQNPSFELAYWRWAIETAQGWRRRSGLPREARWDEVMARLPPLPQKDGKYVALESQPDTWDDVASRHDHPAMLMSLGFLPETAYVDRDTMSRTLDAVLGEWDWETKIWGWDYPMVAMTATRLGRPEDAVEILLKDGPNNLYMPNGHCPQGSDRARARQTEGRREIAAYLPANGAFLTAVALMVAGWQGWPVEQPGFPKDGSWTIRAESLQPLP